MNEIIITGIFICIATILGAVCTIAATFYTNKKDKERKILKEYVEEFADQLISYWKLEDMYADALSKYTSKKPKTQKEDMRDAIVEDGYTRPKQNNNEIEKRLKEIRKF